MPKKSKFQPTLADLEEIYPAGQKHLAKALGVSDRTVRYWKTGERNPTKAHIAKLLHKKVSGQRYVRMVEENYDVSRKQAIKRIKKQYIRENRKAPTQKESQKWLPPYPSKKR